MNMMGMDPLDDTEHWAHVAGEELALALKAAGIEVLDCFGDEDGVNIAFGSMPGAEALLTIVADGKQGPGSLYDRASSSCITLSQLAQEHNGDVPDEAVAEAFRAAWDWTIHPHMRGRIMGWHVSVTMPAYDANTITATLNALRLGGAL
ncbi:hypothetical protein [Streptomyces phage phiSAJS1]|uniref:hypothetical protein n=1 Tax=Streptomyces phage phiSAJS1 TaxID=1755682 RepID=UPI000E30A684|nr:hypothetical protein AVT91_p64 [Streptomyces phage phiSAJS1]ALO79409.2 hypothetical protein [Streptomyces phage phiSAJS1]